MPQLNFPTALAQRIDALLPQTQCTRCGYPACRDYAEAIARDEADINQCPPGGAAGIMELAALLGCSAKPLNPENGIEKPAEVAIILEAACIGCTKCIQVCPVDAIVGAQKLMHAILTDECSGCELCIPACPVDCIAMVDSDTSTSTKKQESRTRLPALPTGADARDNPVMVRADQYRRRFEARNARLARARAEREEAIAARKAEVHAPAVSRSSVHDAIARAKARKEGRSQG
jgi:electron transport complex protein RnfB